MKLFTNLPGNLRAVFGFLRIAIVVLGFCWLLDLIFSFSPFNFNAHVKVTAGDIALHADQDSIVLASGTSTPGSLALTALRGTLVADFASNDEGLVAALHRAIIPSMAVIIFFSYMLATAFRDLCANIEVGEVFIEKNLRLIRGIGVKLIAYSLANLVLGIWASAVMGSYLRDHVVLKAGLNFSKSAGAVQFELPQYLLSIPGGLLAGCLVLVLSQAFRQGLRLKAENDLTV